MITLERLMLRFSWFTQSSEDRRMGLSLYEKGNGPLLTKVSALSVKK